MEEKEISIFVGNPSSFSLGLSKIEDRGKICDTDKNFWKDVHISFQKLKDIFEERNAGKCVGDLHYRKRYILVDGVDCVGKSTLCKNLMANFSDYYDHDFLPKNIFYGDELAFSFAYFPTDAADVKLLASTLDDSKDIYLDDFFNHYAKVYSGTPSTTVNICDRSFFSTIAYQCFTYKDGNLLFNKYNFDHIVKRVDAWWEKNDSAYFIPCFLSTPWTLVVDRLENRIAANSDFTFRDRFERGIIGTYIRYRVYEHIEDIMDNKNIIKI